MSLYEKSMEEEMSILDAAQMIKSVYSLEELEE